LQEEQLQAIAASLAQDLRAAGPQFTLEITPTPSVVRGFRERVGKLEEEGKLAKGLVENMGEPYELAIALRVDGRDDMWLVFWSGLDPVEQLENLLDQAQDTVMETLHEMWPECPIHGGHMLLPRATADSVVWQCEKTEQPVARFGELANA
jgi:hypothetical protein